MKKIAALLLLTAFGSACAQILPQAARERIIKATVMLMPAGEDGKLQGTLGSGSVISPAGFILTNYHVVGDPDNRRLAPWILVRTIRFVDQAPVPTYWGKVVAADPNLDLAIVKIVEDKDQKAVSNLNLPFVQLGDSNTLTLGDPVYVFGFQGTGGETLSFSQGSVGGFTGDDLQSSGRQWIKHDAQTGPGNSGGGAYDVNGDLIGIHSAGVSGDHNSRTSFMRPIAVAWGLITPNVPKFAVRQGTATMAGTSSSSGSSSGSTSQPRPSSAAGSAAWPPKIAVGQTWGFALKGDKVEEVWQLSLSGLSAKGNPKGTASNGKRQTDAFFYYDSKEDVVWLDLPIDQTAFYSCGFEKGSQKDNMWTGDLWYFKDANANGEKIGACGAVEASAKGTGGSTTTGTRPSNTGTPGTAAKLSWPLKPQPGQRWQFQIERFGVVNVTLKSRNSQGAAAGVAVVEKTELNTEFYYDEKDDTTWLDISDNKSLLYCAFEKEGMGNGSLSGTAYYRKDTSSNADAEKLGSCTGKLN